MSHAHDDAALPDSGPILSSLLAECPELADIVEEFVHTLPQRIEEMQNALRAASFEQLKRLAHQLKGAGGSHGYEPLTETAAYLEIAAQGKAMNEIEERIHELNELVQRVQAGLTKSD